MLSSQAFRRFSWVSAVLFSALWACPAQTLLGADPAFVGVLALAVDAEVSKKLALTDEVKGQLTALIEKRETEALELALSVKELPAEEKAAKLAAFVADSEKEGFKLLTNSQKARLEEARVLKAGMSVLAESKIAKALEFTDEQKAEVAKLLAERTAEMAKASGDEERQKTAANYERNLQALLSKEQRAVWERLAGLNAPEQTAEAETPKTEPKTDPRTGRPPVGPVRGTDPRGGKPEAKPSLPGASKDGKVQFSFKYAPWKDVIEWFASTADLSLVGDVFPQGTFNYTDTKRYTPDEALDILNSVLLTKGYTLVRRERMLLLVDVENNKIPEVLISIIPVEELDTRGKYEMVKVLFTLKKMTLEEAERDVRKMLGPQGALVALPTAKQILVTESAGTLRVIRSMINAVENPEVSRDDQFVEVKLSKVSPDEALMMVRPLMGILDGQNRLSDGSLSIAVDQLGFRLIVSGRPEKITRLQEIIKMVDVGNNIVGTSGTVIEQAQIEVYLVTSADLETVKAVFTTMLAGQSDARLSVDPKTNSIIVMAKPTQHRGLAATLAQLQGASNNPKVIQLRMLDPTGTQLLIKNMFGTDASAPKVEVDVATRKLIIRGTLSQYEQIKSMLKDLGEDDAKIAQSNEQRGNVRLIPLPTSSSATRDALDQIDSIWPTIRSNPVTVRNLSAKDRDSSLRTRGAPAESKAAPRASEEPEGRPALKYDPTRPAARRPEANRTLPVGPGSQRPRIIYTSDSSYISHLDDAPESKAPEAKTPETKAPETPATQEPKAKEPVAKEPVTKEPVAQEPVDKAPVAKKPEVKQEPKPSETTEPADVPTEPKNPEAPKKVSVKGAEIVVSIGPGGILIASDDTEALNDFEELLRRIITVPTQPGANFTVFYLKYAKADLASELLMEIIGGAPADTGGGGSLLGDMLGGGNLFGSLLGLGGGGAAATTPIKTSGQVSVVPDTRLNALVVQGNAADLALVEKLLETIDQESSPEPPELNGKPRMIMLENIPATEAASVVQSVFASRIAGSAAGGGQNRQPSPQEFMQALRGGGGNNRRTQRTERSEPKMTLGVDARSNALIVSAPEPLFMEVKLLCEQLDHAGEDSSSSETTRVVTLKRTNPEVVQRALTSITGGTVKSNTTQTPLTQTQLAGGQGQRGAQGQRGTQGGQQPQMDINTLIRGLQGGGNRGGAQGGGNRGGTQGGGSRGGTQGGGSRSGTQGGGSRGGSQGGGRGGFQ